jgi:hypothetical protein
MYDNRSFKTIRDISANFFVDVKLKYDGWTKSIFFSQWNIGVRYLKFGMEIGHKYIKILYKILYKSIITNMATVQKFENVFDTFNVEKDVFKY